MSMVPNRPDSGPASLEGGATRPLTVGAVTAPVRSAPVPGTMRSDVEVTGSYKDGESEVKVVGICEVGDGSLDCWDIHGKPANDVAKSASSQLLELSKTRQLPPFPNRFGNKNRLLVIKSSAKASRFGSTVDGLFAGSLSYSLPRMVIPPGKGGLRFAWAVEEGSAKETFLTCLIREPVPDAPLMDCKVGSSVMLGGSRFEITSIEKASEGAQWQIHIAETPGARKIGIPEFKLLDKTDRSIGYADGKGNAITRDEYDRVMNEAREASENSNPEEGPIKLTATPKVLQVSDLFIRPRKQITLTVSVDPSQISKISIAGAKTWTVKINGLPLSKK